METKTLVKVIAAAAAIGSAIASTISVIFRNDDNCTVNRYSFSGNHCCNQSPYPQTQSYGYGYADPYQMNQSRGNYYNPYPVTPEMINRVNQPYCEKLRWINDPESSNNYYGMDNVSGYNFNSGNYNRNMYSIPVNSYGYGYGYGYGYTNIDGNYNNYNNPNNYPYMNNYRYNYQYQPQNPTMNCYDFKSPRYGYGYGYDSYPNQCMNNNYYPTYQTYNPNNYLYTSRTINIPGVKNTSWMGKYDSGDCYKWSCNNQSAYENPWKSDKSFADMSGIWKSEESIKPTENICWSEEVSTKDTNDDEHNDQIISMFVVPEKQNA